MGSVGAGHSSLTSDSHTLHKRHVRASPQTLMAVPHPVYYAHATHISDEARFQLSIVIAQESHLRHSQRARRCAQFLLTHLRRDVQGEAGIPASPFVAQTNITCIPSAAYQGRAPPSLGHGFDPLLLQEPPNGRAGDAFAG